MWGKISPYLLLVGVQISTAIKKISLERPQKPKARTMNDPAVHTQAFAYHRDICTSIFIAARVNCLQGDGTSLDARQQMNGE